MMTWVQDCESVKDAEDIIAKTDMSDKPEGSYYLVGVPRYSDGSCSLYFCDPTAKEVNSDNGK